MFIVCECPHCKSLQVSEVRKKDSARFNCKHCDCKKKIFQATGRSIIIHGHYDDSRLAQKVCSDLKFQRAQNVATDFVSGSDFN